MFKGEFKTWMENTENSWKRLYRLLIQSIHVSPFKDIRMHYWIVEALRNVGLDEDADELELLKPTKRDLETANRPMEIGLTFAHILKNQKNDADLQSFRMTAAQYSRILEGLVDKVWEYGTTEFGWDDSNDKSFD